MPAVLEVRGHPEAHDAHIRARNAASWNGSIDAPCCRIARVGGADVVVIAAERGSRHADTVLACFRTIAKIDVRAACSIRNGCVCTRTYSAHNVRIETISRADIVVVASTRSRRCARWGNALIIGLIAGLPHGTRGSAACADAGLAGVSRCAEQAVIAGCSIGSDWVAAYTCCRITDARRMALIEGGANYRCSRHAGTVLACFRTIAKIDVRAACSIRNGCVCTRTYSAHNVRIETISRADIVVVASTRSRRSTRWGNALIIGLIAGLPHGTRGPAACADAVLASVGHCAEEIVIAACSISGVRVAAYACCRITDARRMALIEGGANDRCSATDAIGAHISCRAQIVVVAGCSIGSIRVAAYTCCRITGARRMALIGGGANYRCSATDAIGAHIRCRAQIVVVAGCSIGSIRVAAYTCCRITDARRMALIGGGANYRCSAADAIGAHISCRARIVVIADCSVCNRCRNAGAGHAGDRHAAVGVGAIRVHRACSARAGCRITGRWWRAHDRCSAAGPIGAYIICRAQIVVVAGCSIGSIRVAAYTCCRITGARRMALIGGGANYR